ncbi:TonB-dependent receptor [Sphingobacterium suaedae]|uniref:TonB-dependent receptor n=1 Tax=Sphingobacterium suaedae TaxID=1686402 RepID=A0ABW5KIX7_9SPHI
MIEIDSALVVVRLPLEGAVVQLSRWELSRIQAPTLGETLSHVPGVQNASFGPSAGLPMVRSLSGNRVRLLQDGLAINDLSGISPNINTNVDIENLQQIELYKGSASVLFGGKAIGGAINMKDNTIPQSRFPKMWQGSATLQAGTNSGHRQAVQLGGNLGKHWIWRFSGINHRHRDLRIPGNTKAPIAYDPAIDHLTADMAQVHVDKEQIRNLSLYPYISQFVLENMDDPKWGLSEADLYTFEQYSVIGGERVANPSNNKFIAGQDPSTPLYTTLVHGITDFHPVVYGVMPNSHADGRSFNFGISYIKDSLRVGIGYRAQEGYYGIPGFALATKPTHTHEPINQIADYQPINTRTLAHMLKVETVFNSVNKYVRELAIRYSAQYGDDRELVGIYRVNKFISRRQAWRVDSKQQFTSFWEAETGADFNVLHLEGDGIQRYIPNSLSRELGIFTMHTVRHKPLVMNVGYRRDFVTRRALTDMQYKPSRGLAGGQLSPRDFVLNQFSSRLRWNIVKIAFLTATFSHSERAPDINELYAGNDHFAILVEENGDDNLNKEQANSFEIATGLQLNAFRLIANRYLTDFDGYLYLAHTGMSRSGGFLVKEWRASQTRITGWELEASYDHQWKNGGHFRISAFGDLVKNINTSEDHLRGWAEGDYMPNLPTSRYGISTIFKMGKGSLSAVFERYLKQRYLGKNINPEPPMPAYSLLQAQLGYDFRIFGKKLTGYLSGHNLLNVEARPQNSMLKYLAPLPGRNISMGVKVFL